MASAERTQRLNRPARYRRSVPETPYSREPGYAIRYRDARFQQGSGAATDRRERAALRRLLGAVPRAAGPWLDAPSGTGRMTGELPHPAVRVDRDPAMLAACDGDLPRACASVHALPFRSATFAGALCHRLLQHIPTPGERIAILRELARVTRGPIVVSFFDAATVQHWRRQLRRAFGKRRSGRSAVRRAAFVGELAAAGLRVVAMRSLRRFVAEQTLVLCLPEKP